MAVAQNIIEKIWNRHLVLQREGHPAIFAIDFMLLHEVTSAQAFQVLREKNLPVFDTQRLLATLDHSIPTRANRLEIYDDQARIQVEALRTNCKEFGVPLLDFDQGQGIVHIIGPELGITQPGMTIVCGDSHTSTHGAFGALAFGIGSSEVACVLASSCLLQSQPKTMRVTFDGKLSTAVFAKDMILALIAKIGIGGANGHIIEYAGEVVRTLRMDERMTVCNMSIECGARAGLVAPDETTFAYLRGKARVPQGRAFDEAVLRWKNLASDANAKFDRELFLDVSSLSPMITWGTNPGQAVAIDGLTPRLSDLAPGERLGAEQALEYIGLKAGQQLLGEEIQWAFLGSCTNGRIEDLRVAANILKNHRVHPRVHYYIVPGSEAVRSQAIQEGLHDIFAQAGADFRMPGCSMCLGMNDDKVPAGARCISSSNRNFVGRQGKGSRTHLASPATVTASAIAGCISHPGEYVS